MRKKTRIVGEKVLEESNPSSANEHLDPKEDEMIHQRCDEYRNRKIWEDRLSLLFATSPKEAPCVEKIRPAPEEKVKGNRRSGNLVAP